MTKEEELERIAKCSQTFEDIAEMQTSVSETVRTRLSNFSNLLFKNLVENEGLRFVIKGDRRTVFITEGWLSYRIGNEFKPPEYIRVVFLKAQIQKKEV